MGIVFVASQEEHDWSGRTLMDCGRYWGELFVRLTQFLEKEYEKPPVFYSNGQIHSDFVCVNVPTLEALFFAVAKSQDRLFIGWAEYAAGMVEVGTQVLLHNVWLDPRDMFLPIHRGVEQKDIPEYDEDRLLRIQKRVARADL